MIAETDWNGDDGARFDFCLLVHFREKARILRGIRNDDRFAALGYPAGNALPELDANVAQGFRADAGGDLEVEFVLGLVHQEQRPCVRPQHLIDFFHNGAEDLIELQGGGEGLAELVENRDFAALGHVHPDTGALTALNSAKRFGLGHCSRQFCWNSSTEFAG